MVCLGAHWGNVCYKRAEPAAGWPSYYTSDERAQAPRYDRNDGSMLGLCQYADILQLETRDKVKYYEPGPKTPEMQRLNSSFSKLHGASSLLNLAGLFAMFYYGATLAEKL